MANAYYPNMDLDNNFPINLDNFDKFEDLSVSDLAAVNQYYSYYNAGDMIAAQGVLSSNPSLKNKIINATNLNKLRDAVVSMEKFYLEDVHDYITNVVVNRGAYNNTIAYKKYNLVSYFHPYLKATLFYIAVRDTEAGILPTDTTYWEAVTMSGYSPTVNTEAVTNGYNVSFTDLDGTESVRINNPEVQTQKVDDYTNKITVKNLDETDKSFNVMSPKVETETVTNGYNIKISDINGSHNLEVNNPNINTAKVDDYTHKITVKNKNEADESFSVVSPKIETGKISGGAYISITDASGTKNVNIYDGLGLKVLGEWNSTANYAVNDCVTYNSCLWGCKEPNVKQKPSNDSAYWYIIFDAAEIANASGTLLYRGQITFDALQYQLKSNGYMYVVTDPFTTDDTFAEGAGVEYPAYATVYWMNTGKWKVLGSPLATNIEDYKANDVESAIARGDIKEGDIFLINDDYSPEHSNMSTYASKEDALKAISNGDLIDHEAFVIEDDNDELFEIDSVLDVNSLHPVQNKVVTAMFNTIMHTLSQLQVGMNIKTVFNADGSITETGDNYSKITSFNDDGSITETISIGEDSFVKKTIFNADGSIDEVIE